jgi:hypothetical protein
MGLDRINPATLSGADGIIVPQVIGLVDGRREFVAVAPAAAGAGPISLQVIPLPVGRDPIDDLGHFVILRHGGEINAPAAIAFRRRRVAEEYPAEIGGERIPPLDHGTFIGAGVGSAQHTTKGVVGEFGEQPVEHHVTALLHLRILGPRG